MSEQSAPIPFPRPRPLGTLIASAQRLTSTKIKNRAGFGKAEAWQDDAWEMYDLVGEQRFLASTLAGRISQARLYVGKVPENPTEAPTPLQGEIATEVFGFFGDTPQARAQMLHRMAINLFVAGDGWFCGIPKMLMPDYVEDLNVPPPSYKSPEMNLDDLEWRMLSVSEVTRNGSTVTLKLGEDKSETVMAEADDLFLIRVWRPHPRRWWQADSPTRSSLSVLRELVGLTMHISAQVDSRLAGAGLLIVPQSAQRALNIAAGLGEDAEGDQFTEALMEAMMIPIQDRASASAVVPLVVTVPDEITNSFNFITFAKPLDSEARNLRDEAIRRLALGQDAPPELLLGTGGMNHWGAWLVREDVVTTHLEPPLSLICDAITTQYLWPVLVEQGMTPKAAEEYVVWYDVSHMVMRPNRLADATQLHAVGAISDEALRTAGGFEDTDAPTSLDKPVEYAIEMARNNPALVDNLKDIIAAFKEVLSPSLDLPESPTDTGESVEEPVDELKDKEQAPETTTENVAMPEERSEAGKAPAFTTNGGSTSTIRYASGEPIRTDPVE